MSTESFFKTKDRVYLLSGADARNFLQGQVTCDIRWLDDHGHAYGAACSPKGRVVSTFWLTLSPAYPESILIHAPFETADALYARLQKYMMFSKATMTPLENIQVLGQYTPSRKGDRRIEDLVASHPLHPALPLSFSYLDTDKTAPADVASPGTHRQWLDLEIQYGIPRLQPAHIEQFVPQALNLVELGAVSFSKGCYTGQEIVARIKFLGKEKKQLALLKRVQPTEDSTFGNPGDRQDIFDSSGQKAGDLIGMTGDETTALAVLNGPPTTDRELIVPGIGTFVVAPLPPLT